MMPSTSSFFRARLWGAEPIVDRQAPSCAESDFDYLPAPTTAVGLPSDLTALCADAVPSSTIFAGTTSDTATIKTPVVAKTSSPPVAVRQRANQKTLVEEAAPTAGAGDGGAKEVPLAPSTSLMGTSPRSSHSGPTTPEKVDRPQSRLRRLEQFFKSNAPIDSEGSCGDGAGDVVVGEQAIQKRPSGAKPASKSEGTTGTAEMPIVSLGQAQAAAHVTASHHARRGGSTPRAVEGKRARSSSLDEGRALAQDVLHPAKTRCLDQRLSVLCEVPLSLLAEVPTESVTGTTGSRRSGRLRHRPLDFWRGERPVYGRGEGDAVARVVGAVVNCAPRAGFLGPPRRVDAHSLVGISADAAGAALQFEGLGSAMVRTRLLSLPAVGPRRSSSSAWTSLDPARGFLYVLEGSARLVVGGGNATGAGAATGGAPAEEAVLRQGDTVILRGESGAAWMIAAGDSSVRVLWMLTDVPEPSRAAPLEDR